MQVRVRTRGARIQDFMLTVEKLQTIATVRKMIDKELQCNRQLVLICAGSKLKNRYTLAQHNLSEDEDRPDTIIAFVTHHRIRSESTKIDSHDRPDLDAGADISMDYFEYSSEFERAEVWQCKYDRSIAKKERSSEKCSKEKQQC